MSRSRPGRRRLWSRHRSTDRTKGDDGRLHFPSPGDIASASAELLFAEPFALTGTQGRLEDIAEAGGLANTLPEAAEIGAAFVGTFLHVTWDAEHAARPLITVMHPDRAVPEFSYGTLRAVTFWRELPGSDNAPYGATSNATSAGGSSSPCLRGRPTESALACRSPSTPTRPASSTPSHRLDIASAPGSHQRVPRGTALPAA